MFRLSLKFYFHTALTTLHNIWLISNAIQITYEQFCVIYIWQLHEVAKYSIQGMKNLLCSMASLKSTKSIYITPGVEL